MKGKDVNYSTVVCYTPGRVISIDSRIVGTTTAVQRLIICYISNEDKTMVLVLWHRLLLLFTADSPLQQTALEKERPKYVS